MSRKNKPEEKKLRALRRALKKGRMPVFLDLEQWLKDRRYANTVGAARKLIFERRVMHASHPLGFRVITTNKNKSNPDAVTEKKEIYWPYVPSDLRTEIYVKEL